MGYKNNILFKLAYLVVVIANFVGIVKTTQIITDLFLKGSFYYTWLFLHHTLQLIIVVTIILLPIWNKPLDRWGFNLNSKEQTFSIIKKFTIGWIICATVFTIIGCKLSGWPSLFDFEVNFKNILIYFLFESTIAGISEEIFFRGLIYGILLKHFSKKIKLLGFSISQAGIISSLIFSLAHVGFSLFPFAITHYSILQVIAAFALGCFYSIVLETTGSLLGPIIAHNITNVWLSILYLGIQLVVRGV